MPRNDGNKPLSDLKKKMQLTTKNVQQKRELLNEFAENLTPEKQTRAKSKINNKMRALKHMKSSSR